MMSPTRRCSLLAPDCCRRRVFEEFQTLIVVNFSGARGQAHQWAMFLCRRMQMAVTQSSNNPCSLFFFFFQVGLVVSRHPDMRKFFSKILFLRFEKSRNESTGPPTPHILERKMNNVILRSLGRLRAHVGRIPKMKKSSLPLATRTTKGEHPVSTCTTSLVRIRLLFVPAGGGDG